jgi:hypothetical protein
MYKGGVQSTPPFISLVLPYVNVFLMDEMDDGRFVLFSYLRPRNDC